MELEFDHTVYRLLDDVLVQVTFEMIPAVPSHRRWNAYVIVKGKGQWKQQNQGKEKWFVQHFENEMIQKSVTAKKVL